LERREIDVTITMTCDHCKEVVSPDINGGVRLRLGKKEYVFHLCDECQELLRRHIKENFLNGSSWKEI
jgi:RNase P subunit RPR2